MVHLNANGLCAMCVFTPFAYYGPSMRVRGRVIVSVATAPPRAKLNRCVHERASHAACALRSSAKVRARFSSSRRAWSFRSWLLGGFATPIRGDRLGRLGTQSSSLSSTPADGLGDGPVFEHRTAHDLAPHLAQDTDMSLAEMRGAESASASSRVESQLANVFVT